jgi:hypothetical protein
VGTPSLHAALPIATCRHGSADGVRMLAARLSQGITAFEVELVEISDIK